MLWIGLSILSAVLMSVRVIVEKSIPSTVSSSVVLWVTTVVALPVFLIVAWQDGFVVTNSLFWVLSLCAGFLGVGAHLLFLVSLRQFEVSKIIPLTALSPLVLLVLEILFLGAVPSIGEMGGILIMVVGLIYFHWDSESEHSPLDVLRNMLTEKDTHWILLSLILMGVLGIWDKVGSQWSSPGMWLLVAYGWYILALTGYIVWRKKSLSGIGKAPIRLIGVGLLHGGIALAITIAMQMTLVANVIAIKRSSILLVVIYSYVVYKEDLAIHRLKATIVLLAGMACILYYG